jgi:hypothetical protein
LEGLIWLFWFGNFAQNKCGDVIIFENGCKLAKKGNFRVWPGLPMIITTKRSKVTTLAAGSWNGKD